MTKVRGVSRVVALTASFRRPAQLAQLLASLGTEAPALAGATVVDNASDPSIATMASRVALPTTVLTPERNLGCGGGIAFGLREVLRDTEATHVWIFDDDAVAAPGALEALLKALEEAQADVAVPLITDAAGRIGWFPGPLVEPAWSVIRTRHVTPAGLRQACGLSPLRWSWAPWTSLLVTRRAVEAVGLPRDDYWFQGEDLEWTLRLSARFACVLVPGAECRHLPPSAHDREREFLKQALMLQNNFFTATRLAHGRRLLRHAPGNVGRFLRANGWASSAWAAAGLAFWRGAVRGGPAGAGGTDGLRLRWLRSDSGRAP